MERTMGFEEVPAAKMDEATYRNLEGAVSGTRVGIYFSTNLDGPWWNEKVSGMSTTYSVLLRACASGRPEEESDMSKCDDQNR
eukprot:1245833-Karenia_brevis.AAC.1